MLLSQASQTQEWMSLLSLKTLSYQMLHRRQREGD